MCSDGDRGDYYGLILVCVMGKSKMRLSLHLFNTGNVDGRGVLRRLSLFVIARYCKGKRPRVSVAIPYFTPHSLVVMRCRAEGSTG